MDRYCRWRPSQGTSNWCGFRERSFLPHLSHYNAFVTSVRDETSLSVIFPSQKEPPQFRAVGSEIQTVYPALRDGLSFASLEPITLRTTLTMPFHEVRTSRQPDCRRGTTGHRVGGLGFEELLLPFGDDHFQVRLIHALFAFADGR